MVEMLFRALSSGPSPGIWQLQGFQQMRSLKLCSQSDMNVLYAHICVKCQNICVLCAVLHIYPMQVWSCETLLHCGI